MITMEEEKIQETEIPKESLDFLMNNTIRLDNGDKSVYVVSALTAERACQLAIDNQWIELSRHPLEEGVEVIGYNKFWIDPDFNPNGTRIGFINGNGEFTSAKWVNDQDCYSTMDTEGDDYFASQQQDDGTVKTWCDCPGGGEMLGYLPNMPTHYMLIPKHP